jgi:hypothetical protein
VLFDLLLFINVSAYALIRINNQNKQRTWRNIGNVMLFVCLFVWFWFYVTPTQYSLFGDVPALLVEEDLRCPSVHFFFRHGREWNYDHSNSSVKCGNICERWRICKITYIKFVTIHSSSNCLLSLPNMFCIAFIKSHK